MILVFKSHHARSNELFNILAFHGCVLSLLPPEAVLLGLFGLMLAAAAAALGGGGLVSYGYLVRVHVVDTVSVPRLAAATPTTAGPARLDRLHLGCVTRLLVLVQGLAYALGHFHGTSEGDGAATRLLLLAACGLLVD